MTAEQIYQRAENNGVTFEGSCSQIKINQWEDLMDGATRADKRRVDKIVSEQYPEFEIFVKYHNPYNHYKTDTHLIFVHSSTEHFFRIN